MVFSIFYAFFVFYNNLSTLNIVFAYELLAPITLYVIGYRFSEDDKSYRKSFYLMLLVVISLSMVGFLSLLKTINLYGSMDSAASILYGRYVIQLWNDNPMTATGANTFISLGLILLPMLFVKDKEIVLNNRLKGIMFFCLIASCYTAFQLGNRTSLLIVGASVIMIYFFNVRINITKVIKTIVFSFPILFLSAIAFYYNFFGMREKWENSLFANRLSQQDYAEDPRFQAWGEFSSSIFRNPLGGRVEELSLNYAHNMWLDVGYDAGIIPFLFLVVFTLLALTSILKFLKGNHPVLLKSLVLGITIAMFITFMLEPIFQGWFYYFTIFCLILGSIHRLLYDQSN